MTVSAALIVRDEEFTLPHCLDSIADAVDEIIIVDTGSLDRTIEIAQQYTDKVFHFGWVDDFSAARNYAFSKATGDWLMWCDADDIIIGADRIRALAAVAPPDLSGYFVRYAVEGGDFWRERLVRAGAFTWRGRCHEVLEPVGPCRLERTDQLLVEHRSPPERRPAKNARNLALLERELVESGDRPSPRTLYYLGRELLIAGYYDRALATLTRFVNVADAGAERYSALTLLAGLHRQRGDFTAAIDADLRALRDCPSWPNAFFGLAHSAAYQGDPVAVVAWVDLARSRPPVDTVHLLDSWDGRWCGFYQEALAALGAVEE